MNTSALIAWAWGILSDAIEGFAHGAVIGTGLGAVEGTAGVHAMVQTVLLAGGLGAAKQALLYLNTNRIPSLVVSPSPTPVSTPTATS